MADNKKKKQLVLVIEGTAALAPFWSTIFFDYLSNLIRLFCGNEATGSSSSSPNVELALVIFNTRNSYTSFFVQRSTWTRDVKLFFDWLSAIHFTGGGFCDAGIADGLLEALLMFPSLDGKQIQQNEGLQRHCILVAASNPYLSETQSESGLSDANTVAKSFPQYGVSLSVICPTRLQKLTEIFIAGKRNPSAPDLTTDIVKNPDYLVLISENFMEACATLSPSEIPNVLLTEKIEPSTESNDNVNILKPVVVSGLLNPGPSNLSQSRLTNPTILPGGTATGLNYISRQVEGMQSVEVNNNNMPNNVGLPQQTLKYTKIWEKTVLGKWLQGALGDLFGKRQGEAVFLTRLVAYQSSSYPASLAEDWPSTMLIEMLASREPMNNRKHAGNAQYVYFLALNQHQFLGQLQEKKLCTVIKLPSQTMLLTSVTDKACRLLGMIFPGHVVVYKPRISGQQQPPSSQQQQQQQSAGAGTNQEEVSSQESKT